MTGPKKHELLTMTAALARKLHSEHERAEAYRELTSRMRSRIEELERKLSIMKGGDA